MRVQVLGCGDAFGSGGRFQTCFHVTAGTASFLVDCGATALVSMRRFGVDPNGLDTVFLSHLHGDHFGGLPFLLLDAQFVSRRTRPLTIVGPAGLRQRLTEAMEVFFPGSSKVERRFATEIVEIEPERPETINGTTVTGFEVRHPSGAPSLALRLEGGGQVLCYTGDTEWVDNLVPAARGADLLIAEAYTYDRPVPYHLDWSTLNRHLPAIAARRVVVTHLSPDMLHRVDGAAFEACEDGLILDI